MMIAVSSATPSNRRGRRDRRRKDTRACRAEKETGRVEAFSDCAFAIAVTLPILEIKVPKLPFQARGVLRRQRPRGCRVNQRFGRRTRAIASSDIPADRAALSQASRSALRRGRVSSFSDTGG